MKTGLLPAAGLARRLGIDTPKEMLPFGGKPIIDYNVEHLLNANMDKLVVVIREGKEAIKHHLSQKFPGAPIQYVYQNGRIGNLINGIKAGYDAIKGHVVYFCMADTMLQPNPFLNFEPVREVTLMCFISETNWRHFGVIDTERCRIVDKPSQYVSSICWGAIVWRPAFTERIMGADDFPGTINKIGFDYQVSIDVYKDIGIKKEGSTPIPIGS